MSGFAKGKDGRPLKYTPDELANQFEDYLDHCAELGKPLTLLGFCNFIGVYKDYISEKMKSEDFSETIKRIRTTCEAYIEESMLLEKVNVTAAIMSLKANFGWKDKVEHSTDPETISSVQVNILSNGKNPAA